MDENQASYYTCKVIKPDISIKDDKRTVNSENILCNTEKRSLERIIGQSSYIIRHLPTVWVESNDKQNMYLKLSRKYE